jgi:hypothetical protein
MNLAESHLSKSHYLAGLQCDKRLWLGWHDLPPRAPEDPGSIPALGTEVGEAARLLFPEGLLVPEGSRAFAAARSRTRDLLAQGATTIFEGAFAHDGVAVRTDIITRLAGGGWRLIEVKSSTGLKPVHIDDLAVQTHVLRGAGVDVRATALMHVDRQYVRGIDGIDWRAYFASRDCSAAVEVALADVPVRVASMQAVLQESAAPAVAPSGHCFEPFDCEFWRRCTVDKPEDWVFYLPKLPATTAVALAAAGIERMSLIPPGILLSSRQALAVACAQSNTMYVAPDLRDRIRDCGPPCSYLDFETGAPAIPLYPGTRPYQRIAFQWSLHRDRGAGDLVHSEHLADCRSDPRRDFAETLLHACAGIEPIIVYSSFEDGVLRELAQHFRDLAGDLVLLRQRLVDLLPIVRGSLVHTGFRGSYSIKAVAPVLAPELRYDDLAAVADGAAASAAFYRLATGRLMQDEAHAGLREALRRYCARDTLALALVHRALRRAAAGMTSFTID